MEERLLPRWLEWKLTNEVSDGVNLMWDGWRDG